MSNGSEGAGGLFNEEKLVMDFFRRRRRKGIKNDSYSEAPGLVVTVTSQVRDKIIATCDDFGKPVPGMKQYANGVWGVRLPGVDYDSRAGAGVFFFPRQGIEGR
ncbi:MAG: hypothetical protein V4449_00030 [Patescibacteria group bacterium]